MIALKSSTQYEVGIKGISLAKTGVLKQHEARWTDRTVRRSKQANRGVPDDGAPDFPSTNT